VAEYRRTQAEIPAPFATLNGKISLKIGQEAPSLRKGEPIPVKFESDLRSSEQHLSLLGTGQLKRQPHSAGLQLDADLLLRDIRLRLPSLDPLKTLPPIRRDPRIKSGIRMQQAGGYAKAERTRKNTQASRDSRPLPPFFQINLRIHTDRQPITLLYPHFTPAATFSADLKVSNQDGLTGRISGVPFQISLLGRLATLDQLSVSGTR